ncbi:hypothetical protein D3OALGA1CA_1236 [Olavius algarvensis associated proteobacterium Delta 3]|nr:hypothetical protein D3OALGA1CA_1236 [Olavius algarvensis associated proteobacterium Delta 3]
MEQNRNHEAIFRHPNIEIKSYNDVMKRNNAAKRATGLQ